MFVNETKVDSKSGLHKRITIDRDRELELEEVAIFYGEIYFVLKVKGQSIVFDATYTFSGERKNVIEYLVRSVGESLPPEYAQYRFASREEKHQIIGFIEEALKAAGIHHSLSPGTVVNVELSEHAVSFGGDR